MPTKKKPQTKKTRRAYRLDRILGSAAFVQRVSLARGRNVELHSVLTPEMRKDDGSGFDLHYVVVVEDHYPTLFYSDESWEGLTFAAIFERVLNVYLEQTQHR